MLGLEVRTMLTESVVGHGPRKQEARRGPALLRSPFDRLVDAGTLTEVQAKAVILAIDAEQGEGRATIRARSGLAGRIAEIGAYLGAALVTAACVVVVAQQWADMPYGTRVAVMTGTTVTLLVAAVAVIVLTRGGSWDELRNGATLRRLCGTLFVVGALASFGTALVVLLSGEAQASEERTSVAIVVAGLTASLVLVVARWRADTPLVELGLFGASMAVTAGAMQLWLTDQPAAIQWTLLAVGLAWALIGTFTGLLRYVTLVTSLGLALALLSSATVTDDSWSQRLALGTLILVTLTVYLTRPRWPYITTAATAAVVLTVTWVGEAIGAAIALLAAGVVVLVLAGGALIAHNRRRSRDPNEYESRVRGGT